MQKTRLLILALYLALSFGLGAGMLLYPRYVAPALALGISEYQPRPDLPSLQEITAQATSDDEAYQAVVDYYTANRDRLARELGEPNDQRLRGLYAMLLVHISHQFSIPDYTAATFLDYVRKQKASHCNYQSMWQQKINQRLGLDARMTSGKFGHAWLEVRVGDHWESFDATTDTWISRSSEELEAGLSRTYRTFYVRDDGNDVYHARRSEVNYGLTW